MVNINLTINLGKNKHQHQPSCDATTQTNCPPGSDLSINPAHTAASRPSFFIPGPAARYLLSILSVVPLYNWHEKMAGQLSVNQIQTGPSDQDWCKIHNTTTTTTTFISAWDLTITYSGDFKESPLHFITENINVKMLKCWNDACCILYEIMRCMLVLGAGLYHHHEITW